MRYEDTGISVLSHVEAGTEMKRYGHWFGGKFRLDRVSEGVCSVVVYFREITSGVTTVEGRQT
jgi:hypothetical protein